MSTWPVAGMRPIPAFIMRAERALGDPTISKVMVPISEVVALLRIAKARRGPSVREFCKHGHRLSETRIKRGKETARCGLCKKIRRKEYYHRQKAKRLAQASDAAVAEIRNEQDG